MQRFTRRKDIQSIEEGVLCVRVLISRTKVQQGPAVLRMSGVSGMVDELRCANDCHRHYTSRAVCKTQLHKSTTQFWVTREKNQCPHLRKLFVDDLWMQTSDRSIFFRRNRVMNIILIFSYSVWLKQSVFTGVGFTYWIVQNFNFSINVYTSVLSLAVVAINVYIEFSFVFYGCFIITDCRYNSVKTKLVSSCFNLLDLIGKLKP